MDDTRVVARRHDFSFHLDMKRETSGPSDYFFLDNTLIYT